MLPQNRPPVLGAYGAAADRSQLQAVLVVLLIAVLALGPGGYSRAADHPDIAPSRFPDREARLKLLVGTEKRPTGAWSPDGGTRLSPANPEGLTSTESEDDYDVRYSSLDIDITNTSGRTIRGAATHRIQSLISGLSAVTFDLNNALTVDSVLAGGHSVPFTRTTGTVTATLLHALPFGEQATLRVVYEGPPPQSLGVGLYFDVHNGRPFVWNLSEPDGCRNWWPCKDRPDDKADSTDLRVTAQDWMTVTSNGLLRSVVSGAPGTKIWSWHCSYPISTYLVSLTAGDFVRLDDSYAIPGGGTMPLNYWVFPEQTASATTDFSITSAAINAYATRFGPYPFLREKYGVTVFGWGGGMEHQTNTSYGWTLITGTHSYDWIYVHELSHEWWGDNVTCATWADSWLNEGFASWCEAAWEESLGGSSAYIGYLLSSETVYDPSGPIYNYPDPFDGNTVYNKGGWALHMLRGVLGDSTFLAALRDYRALYQGRSVTTEGLRSSFEHTSGRDLSWFWNEWIYGLNRPHYVYSTLVENLQDGRKRLYLHLDQSPQAGVGYFTMPVRIRVTAGSAYNYVFSNDPDHEDFTVDLPSAPTGVGIDPDNWILRTVNSGPYGFNLVSSDLPPVALDSLVAIPLVTRGGRTPYTWGTLDPPPSGLALNPQTGVLSGSAQASGAYSFRVTVRDSSSPARADTQRIRISVVPATSGVPEAPLASVSGSILTTPNPSRGPVRFTLPSASAAAIRWELFDPGGRLVGEATVPESRAGGSVSVVWQGLGKDGRPLPDGVYLIRAQEAGPAGASPAIRTGRFVIVR